MYAGEDGEVCVELGYLGKAVASSIASQPDKSKAGGLPVRPHSLDVQAGVTQEEGHTGFLIHLLSAAWFGEAPVDLDDLVCRLCGRDLFLVAQVYAPMHFERSLCIFGCNRAACSVHSHGWRVIRTQNLPEHCRDTTVGCAGPRTAPSESSFKALEASTPPRSMEPAADAWGADTVSGGELVGDEWGAEAGDWDACEDETTAAAIDALLEKRDRFSDRAERLAVRTCVEPAAAAARNGNKVEIDGRRLLDVDSGRSARRCFPAKSMTFSPEPWGSKDSGIDSDMEKRIRRYREEEEDRGLVHELDKALSQGTGDGFKSKVSSGGARAADAGEKYERTPARAKAVMRFAERVSRSPRQVVRYAYGGEPLWSTSDPPREVVPPCDGCGATRVFEMQLMPALLLQLHVDEFADRETRKGNGNGSASDVIGNNTTAGADDGEAHMQGSSRVQEGILPRGRHIMGEGPQECGQDQGSDIAREDCDKGSEVVPTPSATAEECDRDRFKTWGMEWGVVAMWCCPRSCQASCEEFAVVQLPV